MKDELKKALEGQQPANNVKVLDNFVLEPSPELLAAINQENNARKAVEENEKLKEDLEDLSKEKDRLEADLKRKEDLAVMSMNLLQQY